MPTVWSDANYKHIFPPAQDKTGAWHSCAMKRGTSPAEIYYKRTTDLATWPGDGAAVLAGTISNAPTRCAVTFGNDGLVVVSNGFDFIMQSEAQGIDGSWEAVN